MSDYENRSGRVWNDGRNTHVDRLNPGDNPAYIPGQGPPAPVNQPIARQTPGTAPPGPIPFAPTSQTQGAIVANDQLRAHAFGAAVGLGGSGDEIVANAQRFLLFLCGANDVPANATNRDWNRSGYEEPSNPDRSFPGNHYPDGRSIPVNAELEAASRGGALAPIHPDRVDPNAPNPLNLAPINPPPPPVVTPAAPPAMPPTPYVDTSNGQ